MIRTIIDVSRPAFYGDHGGNGEHWRVTVTQTKQPWGFDYTVQGLFIAEHIPRQYDCRKRRWIKAHDREIPGLTVPVVPIMTKTLAQARAKARRLADVLDGRSEPKWVEDSVVRDVIQS